MVVGELVGLDEVDRTHLGAVLAERLGNGVHGPLHREAALRPAGAAVGRHHHRVGVERLEDDAVALRLVGAEQLGRGDDRDDQAVRRVGAVVVPELDVQPQQPPVVVEADLDVLDLAALMGGRDEVLATVLGELDGPAERLGGQRDQQLFRPWVVDLDAEAAADVGRDHVDLAEVELQLHRDGCPDAGRGLRRGPRLEPVEVRVPARDRAAALHRLAGAALDGQVQGEPVRRRSDRGLRVTDVLLQPGPDVAGHVVVDEALGRAGRGDADHRREHVVVDGDAADRVLGDVAVVGDHERDRFAHVVDLVLGQGVLRAALGQRRVRDEQRQRFGHRAGQVVVGPDGVHALYVEHPGDVDVDDPRMRVGRAQHRGVQGAAPDGHVVDVPPVAAEEPLVLDALDLLAHQLRGHAPSPVEALSSSRSSDSS